MRGRLALLWACSCTRCQVCICEEDYLCSEMALQATGLAEMSWLWAWMAIKCHCCLWHFSGTKDLGSTGIMIITLYHKLAAGTSCNTHISLSFSKWHPATSSTDTNIRFWIHIFVEKKIPLIANDSEKYSTSTADSRINGTTSNPRENIFQRLLSIFKNNLK